MYYVNTYEEIQRYDRFKGWVLGLLVLVLVGVGWRSIYVWLAVAHLAHPGLVETIRRNVVVELTGEHTRGRQRERERKNPAPHEGPPVATTGCCTATSRKSWSAARVAPRASTMGKCPNPVRVWKCAPGISCAMRALSAGVAE